MLDLEKMQDIKSFGLSAVYGYEKVNMLKETIELFEKYGTNVKYQPVLSILIDNINNFYLANQEKDQKNIKNIRLFRDLSILELLNGYSINIVDVIPMQNPVSVIVTDYGNHTVSATTKKIESFKDIERDILKDILSLLNEPESIHISDVKSYLDKSDFNMIFYDDSVILHYDWFKPMASNSMIIRDIETKQEKMPTNCLPSDEIILKKQKSKTDITAAFCPYIFPMKATVYNRDILVMKEQTLARYGSYYNEEKINSQYKRIKITN